MPTRPYTTCPYCERRVTASRRTGAVKRHGVAVGGGVCPGSDVAVDLYDRGSS